MTRIFVPEDESLVVRTYTNGCDDKLSYVFNPTEEERVVYVSNRLLATDCYYWNIASIEFDDADQLWNCNL